MNEWQVEYASSPTRVHEILRARGHLPCLTPSVLAAAFALAQPPGEHANHVAATKEFFSIKTVLVPEGLDSLPDCWLQSLPDLLWATRRPHWERLPYMIRSMWIEEGVLCLTYAQEQPDSSDRFTAWDRLRFDLNRLLPPNLWTPLTRDQELLIWQRWPKLRSELFQLQAGSSGTKQP